VSRDELAQRLADPLNRAVRYPAARALARLVLKTPIQADHVTLAHLAVGLVAAALVLRGATGVLPWALLEARMVLDCLDGVIARARGTASPRGRSNDELADAAGFMALVVAVTIRTRTWALGFALLGVAAVTAAGYAVLKRRLLGEASTSTSTSTSTRLVRVTRWADGIATRIFWPCERRPEPRFVTAVSLLSWDNALPIVHLGVLTGALVLAERAALVYGAVVTNAVLALGHVARARS
jgi:phosphatidylglycerophosphate synthase